MTVRVAVREYLDKIKESEQAKPVNERKPIPTMEEFARRSGVSKTYFIDFTHNRTKGISRDIVDGVITLLRDCGFDTDIQDVLKYEYEKV